MLNTTTFVGLDVHARSIKAVALDAMTGEVRSATFAYDAAAVAEWVRSLDPAAKCVYESGVTGFDLQKRLAALGVDCVVGAVSKMIKPSADRKRKNDRNDAEFLARMLSVGNVVEVWVPDDECEAARDLVRALDDAREDLKRCKQRLSKFLMRHGYAFSETTPTGRRKGNWTAAHWTWIRSISFPEKADGDALAYYVDAVRQAMEDKARLEKLVEAEASKPRWKRRVDSVRCLKGIDVTSAADLVFEAGEFSRFKSARSFAAWLGLTPSEHSSGESVCVLSSSRRQNRRYDFDTFGVSRADLFFYSRDLPSISAFSILLLAPPNSTSLPWCMMRSMMAEASLSSPNTTPHLLNSIFVVITRLRFS